MINFDIDYESYFYENKLDVLLDVEYSNEDTYAPDFIFNAEGGDPIRPECDDLIRLHYIIRSRKILTVLELGVGWSSLVMADALRQNLEEYGDVLPENLRRVDPFTLYVVDTEEKYLEVTAQNMSEVLRNRTEFHLSSSQVTTFDGRICGQLDSIPNVCPDFIYSDGPSFRSMKGAVKGLNMDHQDRTIITGDLLLMEPLLLPRTLILFDGQTNNARWHMRNFQRNWDCKHFLSEDVTVFELMEEPLGIYNAAQLAFQELI